MFQEIREEEIMARSTSQQQVNGQRAAIYARVSDKSQDTEEKTSISEQISDMEAHCERRGLTITARYQEVGRGWSKNRPEFQRMLASSRRRRFFVNIVGSKLRSIRFKSRSTMSLRNWWMVQVARVARSSARLSIRRRPGTQCSQR